MQSRIVLRVCRSSSKCKSFQGVNKYLKGLYFPCRAYEQLNVKHEPLTLITPQFETPLPPLQPAVSTFYHVSIMRIKKYMKHKYFMVVY